MEFYVHDQLEEEEIIKPESPCMMKLINKQRLTKVMPNIWSTMNTIQLRVIIKEMPINGQVQLISAFNPAFWKTQPKTQKILVNEDDKVFDFRSTNEVWVVTSCKGVCR